MYTQEEEVKEKRISRFASPYEEPMAEKPISVRLPLKLDEYVRSLPNRTEWLREAIAAKKNQEDEQKVKNG